jgi:hypothetical protein
MSDILPNGTANIAAASKNDVGTQLRSIALVANSVPIAGNAMLTAELINGVKKLAKVATNNAAILIELDVGFGSIENDLQSLTFHDYFKPLDINNLRLIGV